MASFNSVTLLGNLTRPPEMRYTPSGTAFGAQAEAIGTYLTKGSPALIAERLRWHQWEKDGQRQSKLEVVADSVQFLARREDRAAADDVPTDLDDADIPFVRSDMTDEQLGFQNKWLPRA